MDTSIRTAEFLRCSPETTVTLPIGYIPVQNKKLTHTHTHKDVVKSTMRLFRHGKEERTVSVTQVEHECIMLK